MLRKRQINQPDPLLTNLIAMTEMQSFQDKKVMVLDDCSDTLMAIENMLHNLNSIHVETFNDEKEAVQQFMQEKPDLVVLDMNLKNLNGFKVSIIMQNLSLFKVPIIFISQNKWMELELNNFYRGKVNFLPKPIRKQDFISKIQQELNYEE